jgi:hypothetical protein
MNLADSLGYIVQLLVLATLGVVALYYSNRLPQKNNITGDLELKSQLHLDPKKKIFVVRHKNCDYVLAANDETFVLLDRQTHE